MTIIDVLMISATKIVNSCSIGKFANDGLACLTGRAEMLLVVSFYV